MTNQDDQIPAQSVPVTEVPEEKNDEADIWKQKYLRALADYHNLEKRTAQRHHDDIRLAAKQVLLKLLPVIDVLYKAQETIKDQGLQLAMKQLEDMLQSEQVKRIEVLGQPFDPVTMECIELTDGEGHDTVVEETRSGYTLHDIVIRPAQVKVGKKKERENKKSEAVNK